MKNVSDPIMRWYSNFEVEGKTYSGPFSGSSEVSICVRTGAQSWGTYLALWNSRKLHEENEDLLPI
jgi:hypothetical protein